MAKTKLSALSPERPAWRVRGNMDPSLACQFTGTSSRYFGKEHLFIEGDPCTGVFLIISGTVIVYTVTLNGRRQIQDFAGPGDLLGLNFSGPHRTSAEALTDVKVVIMPQTAFDRALQGSDLFRQAIFDRIDQMIDAARQQTTLLGCKGALEKTATFLLHLETRTDPRNDPFIPIPMSRCDIADFLGLTLETVSRMLSRLKTENIIELPRTDSFRVLDRKALLQIAGLETGLSKFGQARPV